jgi:hypothetical protein
MYYDAPLRNLISGYSKDTRDKETNTSPSYVLSFYVPPRSKTRCLPPASISPALSGRSAPVRPTLRRVSTRSGSLVGGEEVAWPAGDGRPEPALRGSLQHLRRHCVSARAPLRRAHEPALRVRLGRGRWSHFHGPHVCSVWRITNEIQRAVHPAHLCHRKERAEAGAAPSLARLDAVRHVRGGGDLATGGEVVCVPFCLSIQNIQGGA